MWIHATDGDYELGPTRSVGAGGEDFFARIGVAGTR